MRCLVTGASGFLGSWLTRQLLREGHEVLAVVRPGGEHPRLKAIASHIELVYADLGTIKNISTEVKQFAADITFHLAWWGGNSSRHVNDPEQVYTNVPGTLDLVRIAHDAGCREFFYFGTSVEYGTTGCPCGRQTLSPLKNLYGHAKYAMMQLAQALCFQWRCVSVASGHSGHTALWTTHSA